MNRRRALASAFLASAILGLARAEESKDLTELRVWHKGGEAHLDKDRPREEILIKKDGEKVVLVVLVNCAKNGVDKATERRADLTAKDWDAIVEVVLKEKLLEWRPEKLVRPTPWGERGFTVKGKKELTQSWRDPALGSGPPTKLATALGRLARDKIKDLRLLCF